VFWIELPAGTDGLAVYREALAAGVNVTPGRMSSASDSFDHGCG
jgi:DNA-binding transcriptional MocR family regulator